MHLAGEKNIKTFIDTVNKNKKKYSKEKSFSNCLAPKTPKTDYIYIWLFCKKMSLDKTKFYQLKLKEILQAFKLCNIIVALPKILFTRTILQQEVLIAK